MLIVGRVHMQTIHSELDYRLPITEGLAAFNVLQAKKVPSKLLMFPDENHVSLFCHIRDSTMSLATVADPRNLAVGAKARELARLAS
jgi:hypothetical protein